MAIIEFTPVVIVAIALVAFGAVAVDALRLTGDVHGDDAGGGTPARLRMGRTAVVWAALLTLISGLLVLGLP